MKKIASMSNKIRITTISMPAVSPGPNKAFNSFTILNSSTDVYRVRSVASISSVTSKRFEGASLSADLTTQDRNKAVVLHIISHFIKLFSLSTL